MSTIWGLGQKGQSHFLEKINYMANLIKLYTLFLEVIRRISIIISARYENTNVMKITKFMGHM